MGGHNHPPASLDTLDTLSNAMQSMQQEQDRSTAFELLSCCAYWQHTLVMGLVNQQLCQHRPAINDFTDSSLPPFDLSSTSNENH